MTDREAIFDYIGEDNSHAAAAVDDRIEVQVDMLLQTPEMGRPGRIAGTRELFLLEHRTSWLTESKAQTCEFYVSFMALSSGQLDTIMLLMT